MPKKPPKKKVKSPPKQRVFPPPKPGKDDFIHPDPASIQSRRERHFGSQWGAVRMKLSDGEKLILIMLCEIHEKLRIENGVDTDLVKEAIYGGNLWGMKWAFTGIFHDSEPTDQIVTETVKVMDMWSVVESDYEKLPPADKARVEKEAPPFGKDPRFTGFYGNDEANYIGVARFLTGQLDRFQEFKGRDFDAHMPTLDAHRRMLRVFEPLRKNGGYAPLTADDLIQILNARVHPDYRNEAKEKIPFGSSSTPGPDSWME